MSFVWEICAKSDRNEVQEECRPFRVLRQMKRMLAVDQSDEAQVFDHRYQSDRPLGLDDVSDQLFLVHHQFQVFSDLFEDFDLRFLRRRSLTN